jgi:hypothetical protein
VTSRQDESVAVEP